MRPDPSAGTESSDVGMHMRAEPSDAISER